MLLRTAVLSLVSAVSAAPSWGPPGISFFNDEVIFVPPADYTNPGVLYARTVELWDGTLLATWENYSPEPPPVYYPIFQSKDNGVSWRHISNITDEINNWGMRYQPFLYELPRDFGGFPAGTVLAAGNSIPEDLSKTQIEVYASTDMGLTWCYVSTVAKGGEALPDNGLTPVWEPFILLYGDEIIVYYSDQRDPAHGQKLSHQTSRDLRNWSPPVTDVSYWTYTDRPGMTTVAELPNGKYIMTYEYGGGPGFVNYSFPVYYRIADDPRDFNNSVGYPIQVGSVRPQSSPYVTWSSVGGWDGSIIVSCGTLQQIFVNRALGDVNKWEQFEVAQPVAYTRSLRVFGQDPGALLIAGAGHLPPSTTNNVSLSVVNFGALLAS